MNIKLIQITIFFKIISEEIDKDEKNNFCQTDVIPKDIRVPPEQGFNHWGQVRNDPITKGIQRVTLKTAQSVFGNLQGPLSIQMVGDQDMSEVITLGDALGMGEILNNTVEIPMIGNISMLKLFAATKIHQICDLITIQLTQKQWSFPCQDIYTDAEPKGQTLLASGASMFSITVFTEKATKDPLYIGFKGLDGSTLWHLFSSGGLPQGLYSTSIYANQCGPLVQVKFKKLKNVEQDWGFGYMEIFDGRKRQSLPNTTVTRVKQVIIGGKKILQNGIQVVERNFLNDLSEVEKKDANTYFDGSCLKLEAKKLVKGVSCSTTLQDLSADFGDISKLKMGQFPNHKNMWVRCPSFCNIGETLGLYIHPKQASLCKAAAADGLIDHTGGVVQVTIAPGQSSQNNEFTVFNFMNVSEASPDDVSFVLSKVDSPMMVEKNVRIINADGMVDTEGRLEVRIGTVWNSVKAWVDWGEVGGAAGKNNDIAQAACRQLAQEQGISLGTNNKVEELTKNTNQEQMICQRTSNFDCETSIVSNIQHDLDLFIKCLDKNPENNSTPSGYFELLKPWEKGATTPVVQFKNKAHFFCYDDFNRKKEKQMEIFCNKAGFEAAGDVYPQDPKENFAGNTRAAIGAFGMITASSCVINKMSDKFDEGCAETTPNQNGCTVAKIRCIGFPSSLNPKAGMRDIGRLYPPQDQESPISCSVSLQDVIKDKSGDPGSKYTFKCFGGCATGGILQGIGIYTASSSICKAAVQMGVISDSEGGFVSVTIGTYMTSADGGVNNIQVRSNAFPVNSSMDVDPQIGFTVDEPTTCDGVKLPPGGFLQKLDNVQDKMKLNSNSGSDQESFEKKNKINFLQSRKMSTQDVRTKQYCLQFDCIAPKFYQAPTPDNLVTLDKQTSVDLSQNDNFVNTREMAYENWSMLFAIRIDKFPDIDYSTVFAHSDADGFSFLITNLQSSTQNRMFEFKKTGNGGMHQQFITNFVPIVGEYQNIALTFSGGDGRASFYINDGSKPYRTDIGKQFNQFNLSGALTIGNLAVGMENWFEGTLYFYVLFDTILGKDVITSFFKNTKEILNIPEGGIPPIGQITTDGRTCIKSPKFGKVPGRDWKSVNGIPKDVKQTQSGGDTKSRRFKQSNGNDDSNEDKSTKEGEENKSNKSNKEAENTEAKSNNGKDKDNTPQDKNRKEDPEIDSELESIKASLQSELDLESAKVTCQLSGNDFYSSNLSFQIAAAGTFNYTMKQLKCPKDCTILVKGLKVIGPSAGTKNNSRFTQHMSSSLCGAAVHSGLIHEDTGGVIKFHLTFGSSGQPSKLLNGITSNEAGESDTAVFIVKIDDVYQIKCTDTFNQLIERYEHTEPKSQYYFGCPRKCYESLGDIKSPVIYGNRKQGQSALSRICIAAIHSGILNDFNDQLVTIKTVVKPIRYLCTDKVEQVECNNNGVTSGENNSKIGFKFEGNLDACRFFKDMPTTTFSYRWLMSNVQDQWSEVTGKPQAIINAPTQLKGKNSQIIQQEFECGDARLEFTISANILPIDESKQIGAIFRQQKQEQIEYYYLLKIHPNKIALFKVTDGFETKIKEQEYEFRNMEQLIGIYIYNFKIIQKGDKFVVQLNQEPNLSWLKIMEATDSEYKRGKVGFETIGDFESKILNIETHPPYFHEDRTKINMRSFVDSIEFKPLKKEENCARYQVEDKKICMNPQFYCKIQCNSFRTSMDKQSCQTLCLRNHKVQDMLNSEVSSVKKSKGTCPILLTGRPFKTGMKIDYKPQKKCDDSDNKDETIYAAQVHKAQVVGENCVFEINQVCKGNDEEGEQFLRKEETLEKGRLFKCGQKVQDRKIKKPGDTVNDCDRIYKKSDDIKQI